MSLQPSIRLYYNKHSMKSCFEVLHAINVAHVEVYSAFAFFLSHKVILWTPCKKIYKVLM